MRCPRCEHETPPDAQFCPECGTKLAVLCARCQTGTTPGHKFCKKCGQPLTTPSTQGEGVAQWAAPQSYTPKHLAEKILTSRSTLEGERKQVTVLFCDIVESSRLAERLDPEGMHQLMDRALRLMAEVVHRYEGTVNQFLGDGLMALFGAPAAMEDHALRGVLAALTIRETLNGYSETLKRERGVEIRLRLGLNTGLVVVGRIGDDLRMDYTAVGDSTNLAARMQALAEPGTILITEATHRLVDGYTRSEALGPVTVKGRSDPVSVYKVVGRRRRRSRLEVSAERGLTPLVGRYRELGLLHDRLVRAKAGRGQVVGILGEPGVGKSRLLYEFRKSLEGEEITWLEGHCVAYGQATPYLPIIGILRANFGIDEGDNPLQIQEKIRHGVRRLDAALEGTIPHLSDLFDLSGEDGVLKQLDPQIKQWKTFEAIRALTVAGSQRRPLVLVLEDLQWLDRTSEEYLWFLLDSLVGMRVLLLTTHRPGYAVRWATKTYHSQIALDRLGREEVEELLQALLGTDASLGPLTQLLLDRTEGNPFFLEESVRMLVESETLAGERGAYRLIKPFQTVQVPVTVQAVLAARIDRLTPEDKQLFQTAAVIGKEVPRALLQAVADQPEESVRGSLAHLQAAEFLYETSILADVQYTFTHTLTHEVAYESLLHDRRRALHARVLNAIETLYPDRLSDWADRLAHHVVRGEVWSKARTYFRPAITAESSPLIESSSWWMGNHDQAIELGERELGMAVDFKNFPMQIMAHLRLAQAYHALGNYARALDLVRQNVEFLEGDLLRRHLGMPGLPAVFSRVWLVWCLAERGEFPEGIARGEEAVQIADTGDEPYSLVVAHSGLGAVHLYKGDFQKAISAFESGLALSRTANLPSLLPLVASPLGLAYGLSGRVREGCALLEQAVERAQSEKLMANHSQRIAWLGEACRLGGRLDRASELARRALDLARKQGERGNEAHTLRLLGEIAPHRDPPNAGQSEEHYRQALALAQELGMRPLLGHCHLGLGRLYRRLGRPEQAGPELAMAVDLFRSMDMTFWLRPAEAELLMCSLSPGGRGSG